MLEHKVEKIKNTKDSAKSFLASLAVNDNDFNGNNGPDFLWKCAKGYESNFDYLEDFFADVEDPQEYIKKFIEEWFNEDPFYREYSIGFIDEDAYLIVSVSYIADTESIY